jgi:hypothetical protein
MAALLLLAAAPAAEAAAKKKGSKTTEQADDTEKPGETPASQSADTERPKPILEEDSGAGAPDAPKPDKEGNINFGGAKGAKGRITVKAPEADKVKIYLEGRYFGAAPRTIHKVPAGDYIIELILPGGKRVARPVSVSSDEEALVEVAGADAAAEEKKEAPMTEEQMIKRWKWAKITGIAGASTLVLGGILGIWGGIVVQGQYDDHLRKVVPPEGLTAWQEERDDLERRGNILVNTANVCFVLGGVGIAAAVWLGYPVWKARKAGVGRKTEGIESTPPPVTFMFSPGRTNIAGLAWTF